MLLFKVILHRTFHGTFRRTSLEYFFIDSTFHSISYNNVFFFFFIVLLRNIFRSTFHSIYSQNFIAVHQVTSRLKARIIDRYVYTRCEMNLGKVERLTEIDCVRVVGSGDVAIRDSGHEHRKEGTDWISHVMSQTRPTRNCDQFSLGNFVRTTRSPST